ncbi:MAG: thiamine pyrophosphate-dependent enzyme, partial [Boseongicola sp.]|nr:thiamine pyrophosphate-dependent enzyme [Boseongicola sp.]
EMHDQAALVREACKWTYELRFPDHLTEVLDRGWTIANSTPKGPVYLSLPREVLCEPCPLDGLDAGTNMAPVSAAPDRTALATAAALLAKAERPLVIAQRGAGSQEAFMALAALVEDWAFPLSHYWANQVAIPMTSPCHVDWSPDELVREADVILVVNALAPWWPDYASPSPTAKVIQLGPDPLFARSSPMRTFRSDVTLAGDTAAALLELIAATNAQARNEGDVAKRRARIAALAENNRNAVRDAARAGNGSPMSKEWVSHCLGLAVKGRKASVFHELGCPLPPLELEGHLSYFQEPHSGGLGWGVPAAMGAQLADPERLVFATVGDGSYMFANPVACHQVCEALGLPVIILVLNNEEWGAVRSSVTGLYKAGLAARSNDVPLTSLSPSPDFAAIAEASRAYAETVVDGKELPAALERAIAVATRERRQVLLKISIKKSGLH